MPTSLPFTVALKLSGTSAICRIVPSSIRNTKSLPDTRTTSARSTLTLCDVLPLVVVVCERTWALAFSAKLQTTSMANVSTNRPRDFIVTVSFLKFGCVLSRNSMLLLRFCIKNHFYLTGSFPSFTPPPSTLVSANVVGPRCARIQLVEGRRDYDSINFKEGCLSGRRVCDGRP